MGKLKFAHIEYSMSTTSLDIFTIGCGNGSTDPLECACKGCCNPEIRDWNLDGLTSAQVLEKVEQLNSKFNKLIMDLDSNKNIIGLVGILLGILILALMVTLFASTSSLSTRYEKTKQEEMVQQFNSNFTQFSGKYITMHDVITIKNFADIRNNKIGFVFQGFNLISRTSIISKVLPARPMCGAMPGNILAKVKRRLPCVHCPCAKGWWRDTAGLVLRVTGCHCCRR